MMSAGFPGGSAGKESACSAGDPGSIPGLKNPLEKGTATHCSILAWEIPQTEEPGGYNPLGCKKSDTIEGTNIYNVSINLRAQETVL